MIDQVTKEMPRWQGALTFWPLGLAIAATTGFVWYTVQLAREVTTEAGVSARRFQHFLSGRPNEMGDTLAGFVGSLTLIWVVASVLQQSLELRSQRREFAEMVRAQDAQVRALEAQAEIFRDEKVSREQELSRRTINELFEALIDHLEFSHAGFMYEDLNSKNSGNVRFFSGQATRGDSLRLVTHNASGALKAWMSFKNSPDFLLVPSLQVDVERLRAASGVCGRIQELKSKMASDDLVRVSRYRIGELRTVITSVLEDPELVGRSRNETSD